MHVSAQCKKIFSVIVNLSRLLCLYISIDTNNCVVIFATVCLRLLCLLSIFSPGYAGAHSIKVIPSTTLWQPSVLYHISSELHDVVCVCNAGLGCASLTC